MVLPLQHGNLRSECQVYLNSLTFGVSLPALGPHPAIKLGIALLLFGFMGNIFNMKRSPEDPERWLNHQSRCFGDKGDVEDITEGSSCPGSTSVRQCILKLSHVSRYYIDG